MKLNRKITISTLALALLVSPGALTLTQNNNQIVQAATTNQKGTIQLRKTPYTNDMGIDSPAVYNKNGKRMLTKKRLSPLAKKVKWGSVVKVTGNPITLKGPKIYYELPTQRIMNGTRYLSLGNNDYISTKAMGMYNPKTGIIVAAKSGYVYDQNGKKMNNSHFTRGAKFIYKGQRYYYNPTTYFNIGNGYFVREF